MKLLGLAIGHLIPLRAVKRSPTWQWIVHEELVLAATADTQAIGRPSLEQAQAFAHHVAELHAVETVLPLRYGCMAPAEVFQRWLVEHADDCRERLAAVAGREEFGLRIEWPLARVREEPTLPLSEGRAYLQSRRRHYTERDAAVSDERQRAEAVAKAFAELHEHWHADWQSTATGRRLLMRFLAARGTLSLFQERFAAVRSNWPATAWLTGPWPVYTFALRDFSQV